MRKLTHKEIVHRQNSLAAQPRLAFDVLLNNIRSLYNVGSIFRTADGAGVGKIWLCGITGAPPQSDIAKTALGAQDRVPWEYRKDAAGVIRELRQRNYQIVLLEQMEGSVPYQRFDFRPPVCLVLGNEVEGVAEELAKPCDAAVEIEMAGVKNSLNVGVAFGVVAYHIRNALRAG
ncbi:MAG: RNA methyltransferase [Candidatus Omnitrophota bacterium]|nr:RNA methyltransferase [Candidatus Omnitrophota bacterium]MDZ4241253.1 RNA methyltransferase [Candidatus Omnitrophota bacterium]